MAAINSISVIVPLRNTPTDLLADCLDSIERCAEDFGSVVEVVVIDDFSSEECFEEQRAFVESRHPDVVHIRLPEWHGSGGARNRGVHACTSDYVTFVDGDDLIADFALSKLQHASGPKTVAYGNQTKSEGGRCRLYRKDVLADIFHRARRPEESPFLFSNPVGFPVMIARELFLEVGGYPERLYSGEHIGLWGRLFVERGDVGLTFVDTLMYDYRPHAGSNSVMDQARHIEGKCCQLARLWSRLGVEVRRYQTYLGKRGLPTLYVPENDSGDLLVPQWAEIVSSNSWTVQAEYNSIRASK